jgi:solute carrier family 9 (sodium/hydrogen exchanger), member 6/7
LKIP